jgi:type I restriction enzyme S subunit
MTPQELKNSILQLAIQGKLVEQRPEEGTAEELYQQIQAEKQALIKAGKLKKEKPLPEITEDEKPFDIPESWKWVRISAITVLNPKNELDDSIDTAFIPMPCVSDGYRNEHSFEVRRWGDIKKGFTHFAERDIGIAKITPCFQNRKSVIFQNLPNGYGAGTTELSIVRVIRETLSREYLLWFFKSDHFISNGKKSFTGTAGQQRIHKDYLSTCLLPLPPLAEQKRIVAKIEELLPLIDRYEQAWTRLEDFNKRFPTDLQKSILQLAIQGKLVPQRPEEGTGEELYQQIQAEKQALIKAGKLKKEKPLPEITEEEKPFEIPESWKWVRFSELMLSMSTGPFGSMLHKSDYIENGIPLVNPANIINGKILSSNKMMVSSETRKRLNSYILHSGMIVIGRRGEMGRCAVVSDAEEGWLCGTGSFFMEPSKMLSAQYLQIIFTTPYVKSYLCGESVGTTMSNLNHKILSMMPIPLPPYKEQKRIDSELEYILSFCELKK